MNGLSLATLCEVFQVRDDEVLTEHLNKYGSITIDLLASHELTRGNVDVDSDFVSGEIGWTVRTRTSQ